MNQSPPHVIAGLVPAVSTGTVAANVGQDKLGHDGGQL
jgi:hypothetical protein